MVALQQGTVLSAIAVINGRTGNRIMVATSWRGIDVYVDNRRVEMESFPEQLFDGFTVSYDKSGLVAIQFVNGIYVECRANKTRELMSLVTVNIPKTFMNNTRGLLGNFNGVTSDDLTPVGRTAAPLPVNSSLQTIHNDFGLSCE